MFGGGGSGKGRGSFRKSIYKQLTRPNTASSNNDNSNNNTASSPSSSSSVSSSIEAQRMTGVATPRHRPPALTFSGPSSTMQQQNAVVMASIADSKHALAKSSPAALTGTDGGGNGTTMSPLLPPVCPTAPKTRSAPADSKLTNAPSGRPRCVSAWSYYQQPFHPASSAFANAPLLENITLVVDVNQTRGGSQSGPPSSRSVGRGNTARRMVGQEQMDNHQQQQQQTQQQQQQHHRSISASPHCAPTTAMNGSNGTTEAATAPLLIPLGNRADRHSGTWAPLSARVTQQHRTPPSGGTAGGRSTNIFLATRHDHPTLFDFEDWHTSLDKQSQEAVYSLFMKAHKCYDIIPTSSKLVVFDTELPVSKAFFALVYNGVRAAPLFDSKSQEFIGMLTITDFIQILHKYYKNDQIDNGMKQLEEHKISTWREIFREENSVKSFITIDPLESLHKAAQLLCEHKIHRLPVLEHSTGNILYILTHKRLIKFLYLYINDLPRPPFMDKTPKELGIGSWGDICTISKDTPLIEAMKIFLAKRVSALPLLDSDGRVVDIYAKFDAINLAADKTYDKLDVTVFEALQQRSEWFEGVRKCSEKDSLMTVIDVIVKAEVHRLVVVDDDNHVVGIISLSDILSHLVLEPPSSPGGGGGTERSSRVASAAETSNEGPATQSPAAVDEAAKEMMDFSLG